MKRSPKTQVRFLTAPFHWLIFRKERVFITDFKVNDRVRIVKDDPTGAFSSFKLIDCVGEVQETTDAYCRILLDNPPDRWGNNKVKVEKYQLELISSGELSQDDDNVDWIFEK